MADDAPRDTPRPDVVDEPTLGPVGRLRTLATVLAQSWSLAGRLGLAARAAGDTFDGRRNLDEALGYKKILTPVDYRYRYERGGIAGRIVDALPTATWRGDGELVEDENPNVITPFEDAWFALTDRLHVWATLRRADILSGLGHYSVVLLGAPGDLGIPLTAGTPEQLVYLTPIGEQQAGIEARDLVIDPADPRFGQPTLYRILGLGGDALAAVAQVTTPDASRRAVDARPVHYTRILHLADETLDNGLYGSPKLRRVWNKLDDLDKVTGGGAEAFWLRAHRGLNLNLDKDVILGPEEKEDIKREVEEFEHSMRRNMRTRGVTLTELGSDVADFSNPADAILTQIAGATGIPKRILVGSEAGELASTQDRSNWRDQVTDRRHNYAGPFVVRVFVDRLIQYGFLPRPTTYDIRWPGIQFLDEIERAAVAVQWATINTQYANTGQEAVTPDEIRDLLLDLPPLTPPDLPALTAELPPSTQLETPTGTVVTASAKRQTWRKAHGLPPLRPTFTVVPRRTAAARRTWAEAAR